MNMSQNPSPEFELGQIVFLKSNPSIKGPVLTCYRGPLKIELASG